MEAKKIAVAVLIILALGAGGYYLLSKNNNPASYPFGSEVIPTVTPPTGNSSDSDKDGLPDAIEKILGTNINNMDTDRDGYDDPAEIKAGHNPLIAGAGDKYTPEEWQVLKDKIKAADEKFYKNNFAIILLYEADLTNIVSSKKDRAMTGLSEIIKRRLQTLNTENSVTENENHLEISLFNVKNIDSIIKSIQEAPVLEFRIESSKEEFSNFYKQQNNKEISKEFIGPYFLPTELTGKNIKNSEFGLDPNSGKPIINIEFDEEGRKTFADITTKNIGKKFAVYLDGNIITAPVIQETIIEGKAVIAGAFSGEEAALLVKRLNGGAFSVPIKLISRSDSAPIPSLSISPTATSFICGTTTVKDIDNNIYKTVKIGDQCWLKENLKVTKNPAGAAITRYCYDNDPKICDTDGGLYDWNTTMNNSMTEGAQGICPNGWHVPKDSEWYALEKGLATGLCDGDRDGSYDACSPAGTELEVGGSSGFDALFTGGRYSSGPFYAKDIATDFWSSTEGNAGGNIGAFTRGLYGPRTIIDRLAVDKKNGFSIRCIKD